MTFYRLPRWIIWPVCLLLGLIATCSTAQAAFIDDVSACRCLENLSMTTSDAIEEEVRQDASRIFYEFCREDLSLRTLSGRDRYIAQDSCSLLSAAFEERTERPLARATSPHLEIRLAVEVHYRGERFVVGDLAQWQHGFGLFSYVTWTLHPAAIATNHGIL